MRLWSHVTIMKKPVRLVQQHLLITSITSETAQWFALLHAIDLFSLHVLFSQSISRDNDLEYYFFQIFLFTYTVGDPDLQIRKGWGSGHSDPEIRREGGRTKKKLSSLRASFWSKKKGGSGPPVPSPGSATGTYAAYVRIIYEKTKGTNFS